MAKSTVDTVIRTGAPDGGSIRLGVTPAGGIAAGVWASCSGVIDAIMPAMSAVAMVSELAGDLSWLI